MALFTGAFFVAQVSLIIVAKPFYAIFCTSCVPHKPKVGFTVCQMVNNLERLGTLWYAMKQIWRTKEIIKMASNIEIQKEMRVVWHHFYRPQDHYRILFTQVRKPRIQRSS